MKPLNQGFFREISEQFSEQIQADITVHKEAI